RYASDIASAFNTLSKMKNDVVKWWTAGAIPAQMLNDKEAYMASAWNGRIDAIQAQGAPVEINWWQGRLDSDVWAIPKGAPNRLNAQKFTAFITLPVPQARLSLLIPYGFVNNKAVDYLTPERLNVLPTAPQIRSQLFVYDAMWWADNRDKVIDKWNEWILS